MRPAGRPKASRNGWGDSSMLDAGTRQCPGMRAHRHTGRGVPIRSPSISQDICLPLININNHTGDDLSCCVFCCSETHKSHKTANKTHTPCLDESTRQHVSCGRTPSFFMVLATNAIRQNHHTSAGASIDLSARKHTEKAPEKNSLSKINESRSWYLNVRSCGISKKSFATLVLTPLPSQSCHPRASQIPRRKNVF